MNNEYNGKATMKLDETYICISKKVANKLQKWYFVFLPLITLFLVLNIGRNGLGYVFPIIALIAIFFLVLFLILIRLSSVRTLRKVISIYPNVVFDFYFFETYLIYTSNEDSAEETIIKYSDISNTIEIDNYFCLNTKSSSEALLINMNTYEGDEEVLLKLRR